MSFEASVHPMQTLILRELLFVPSAHYSDLQKTSGLESDHFKFHLARLVANEYIEKIGREYRLTTIGKEYANKIDTDAGVLERQPKSAVILVIERESERGKEYLVQERLKHPYYGFWGFPSGKIRWGESILDTATREMREETGLEGDFSHSGVYHERDIRPGTNDVIEDKIFHIMFCNNSHGSLQLEFQGGRNQWRTLDDVRRETCRYKSFDQEASIGIDRIPYSEAIVEYGEEF
jgi:ADP-ribose pyrophosphatase YjhB (NUDIX family)